MTLNPFKEDRDIMKAAPVPERLRRTEKVLILTGDKTEDMEFFYPYYRLMEAGYVVDVATVDGKNFKGKNGYEFRQATSIDKVRPADYALLYIPGGKAPEELRKNDKVVDFVKQFAQSGKPIAAICHGPQVLITAGLLRGRKVSGYDGIKDELEKAGATYSDEALAIDGPFITSRLPGDLHRHLNGVMDALQKGAAGRAVA